MSILSPALQNLWRALNADALFAITHVFQNWINIHCVVLCFNENFMRHRVQRNFFIPGIESLRDNYDVLNDTVDATGNEGL